jgi:hypothetical protein
LSDFKEGYCSAGFYLNRKFCCWHRPGTGGFFTFQTFLVFGCN